MTTKRRALYRVVVTPSRVTFVCMGCGKREESGQRGVKVGRGAGRVRVFTVYGHACGRTRNAETQKLERRI